MFFKRKRNHNDDYNANQYARTASYIHGIPLDLAIKIRNQKKMNYSIFGDEEVSYTKEEYNLMMLGAMIAYQSQELLGTKIASNDPRCIEIRRLLIKLGVRIQYHPDHGMIMVEDETVKEYNL